MQEPFLIGRKDQVGAISMKLLYLSATLLCIATCIKTYIVISTRIKPLENRLTAAIIAVKSSQPGCLVRKPRTYIRIRMKTQIRGSRTSTTIESS
jgi:hypothetical protein